ncbi:MAG TPA: translation initiation factor IF-2 [Sphingomonadaceae bacterium]|nr:translation initiation factor IF-2 [Sphingomonadaceae bacterium]
MSDSEEKPTRTRKPLGIKRSVEAGEVKQTFSHGRTNKVVVEVKRRKIVKPGSAPAEAPAPAPAPAPVEARPAPAKPAAPKETAQERAARLQREAEEARLKMAEEASRREEEEKQQALEEERRRAEENRAQVSKKAKEKVGQAEEAERAAPEPEADLAPIEAEAGAPAARKFTPVARPEPKRSEKKAREEKKPGRDRGERGDHRRSGKLTVNRALNEDEGRRARSLAALKRAREKERRLHGGGSSQPREKQVRDVVVPEAITVQELANRMAEKGADLVKALFNMGMMVTVNQTIDQDTAELLVEEFGHNIKRVSESDVDIDTTVDKDPEETLKPRPPVITIMGHVDHGKTSLLDALRGTDIVKGEAGGITQHIGAYQITTKNGDRLTFLDTPGHEAFTQMRARGAQVTDIVVLVVAADDGLMPQTIEAIHHTKAAGVPMIVAINKCDKPEANPQKIRERLLEHEVIVEEMSGDVQDVEVSATKKTGLDELIEKITLQAELLELRARPDRNAEATVIEAQLDKGRGPVATVLVNRGTLKRGDVFVVGTESGRVRALVDDMGRQVKEAGPSTPVEVLGLAGVPMAGDMLTVVENEQRAREVSQYRQEKATEKRTATAPTNLDAMFAGLKSDVIEFPLVVKADVQGTAEAIVNALHAISNDEIKARILHSGVGAITESDVTLASASGAPIIGFNVRPNAKARELIERNKTRMKYYDVIYDLTDDIRAEMAGELGPEKIENVVGRAEVKEIFPAGKRDKAAGLLVTEGAIRKGLHARLTRDDVIVSATTIASLRRFKDDVEEVRAGLECGVVLADTNDVKPGDSLEVFEIELRERTL